MKKNPSMSDQDWHWFQLALSARELTQTEVHQLERALSRNAYDMDSRIQLFSYYSQLSVNDYKHINAESEVVRHVIWLTLNKPALTGYIAHRCSNQAMHFGPQNFAKTRQLWLDQVEKNKDDGDVIANAGSFIIWKDYETGAALLEKAHQLQPSGKWLGRLVIHCASQTHYLPSLYAKDIHKEVVKIGMRALQAGDPGAPFLTAEYVADAAFELGQYDIVENCADYLRDWSFANLKHLSEIYQAMVALRKNDRKPALQIMLEVRERFERPDKIFRLAWELLAVGERTAVIQMVEDLRGKIKKSDRERWLKQLRNNESPDFR